MNFFNPFSLTFWKNLFTKDWQAKVGSLVVALLLWWFVYSQTSVQRAFYIPVQYINLAPQLVILKTNDMMVRVTIQGRKDRVMPLKNHQIRVFVDLSSASPGWNTNQIQMTTTELDPTMSVNLEKTTTILFVDTLEVTSLPVVPKIIDSLEKGYEIEAIELRPSSIILKGPSTLLSNLQFVETVPLSLKGVSNSLSTNVGLLLPNGVSALDIPTNLLVIRVRPIVSHSSPSEER
ncbi:MAG: CdaR family protein [Brevinematales bacterium]|nr:CdaR family protein [Brevinematales bacterium]